MPMRSAKYFIKLIETFPSILPLVKRHISTDTSFSVAFLECLLASGEQTKIRKEAVQNVFRDVLCNLIPYFKLEFHTLRNKRMRPMDRIPSIYEPQPSLMIARLLRLWQGMILRP